MRKIRSIFLNPLILIWIVVLIILFPILKPGFFSFHDETHIVDVYEMKRSLEVYGFPPRFVPDFNFNLGHPYYNFYYHLPFYIAALFNFAGFPLTDSYKYMLGIAVILAATGFYLFLRNHVSKIGAVFGTLVYILSPYFAVDLYVRGAPGEMYILAFFPWAGYALYRYLSNANSVNLAFASIPIFLLALSHNVLLPFIYSFIFLYGIVNLLILKTKPLNYLKIFLPFILGVLLASYYLIPALTEVKYISTYEQINIADHFPFIKQLITPHWGYGPSIWGFLDDISFDIGTINLILLGLSVLLFKFAKKNFKILLIFFWAIFTLAVILMNFRTLVFWESIRFLRLVQFPWRMLILTTISTAFIAAIAIDIFSEKFKKFSLGFLVIIFISLMGLNIWHYQPSEYKEVTDERYLELYFANRTLEGNGVRSGISPEYYNFTEDFIPPTIWQSKRPAELLMDLQFATGAGELSADVNGLSYNISYNAPVPNKILVAKTYFPGWIAISNNQTLPVEAYPPYGIIAIPITESSGQIKLELKSTPIQTASNLISAFALIVILVLLIGSGMISRKKYDHNFNPGL